MRKIDYTMTPKKPDGTRHDQDMIRYTRPDISFKTPNHRGSIQPMLDSEKVGLQWGRLSLPPISARRGSCVLPQI
jgi:hypothetical protein